MTIKAGNKQKEKGYQWRKWTNWEKTWACLLKDQKNITDERKLWRILVSDVRVWSNKLNQVSFTRFFTNDRKNILTNKFQCLASLKRRYCSLETLNWDQNQLLVFIPPSFSRYYQYSPTVFEIWQSPYFIYLHHNNSHSNLPQANLNFFIMPFQEDNKFYFRP